MSDDVNHPAHYNAGPVETIDMIEQIVNNYKNPKVGYSVGQVIKYLSRAPLKDSELKDLQKGLWYLSRAIGHLSKP